MTKQKQTSKRKKKKKHFLAFPTKQQSVFMSLVLLYIGNAKIKNVFQLPS
jgi:hypothetical protein